MPPPVRSNGLKLARIHKRSASAGRRDDDGLSLADATDTYGALASPETFALLKRRGWSPARYERWLATNLVLTLLPPAPTTGG